MITPKKAEKWWFLGIMDWSTTLEQKIYIQSLFLIKRVSINILHGSVGALDYVEMHIFTRAGGRNYVGHSCELTKGSPGFLTLP